MLSGNRAQICGGLLKPHEMTFLRLFCALPLNLETKTSFCWCFEESKQFFAAATSQNVGQSYVPLVPATIGSGVWSTEKATTGQSEVVKRLLILPSAEGGFYLKCAERGIPEVGVELVEKNLGKSRPKWSLFFDPAGHAAAWSERSPIVSILFGRELAFSRHRWWITKMLNVIFRPRVGGWYYGLKLWWLFSGRSDLGGNQLPPPPPRKQQKILKT